MTTPLSLSYDHQIERNVRKLNRVKCILDWCYVSDTVEALPCFIDLHVSNRCQLACRYCLRGLTGYPLRNDLMDLAALPYLEQLFRTAEYVELSGCGEPLLMPDIFALITAIKRWGPLVQMFSNGLALSEENARELLESGLDRVFVSIDGPTQKLMDLLRGKADLRLIAHNLRNLAWRRALANRNTPRLIVAMTISRHNCHYLPIMVVMTRRLGADELQAANIIFTREYTEEDPFILTTARFRFYWGISRWLGKILGVSLRKVETTDFVAPKENRLVNFTKPYGCPHLWNDLIVEPDGEAYPCHLLSEFAGNLMNSSIVEVMNAPAAQMRRRAMLRGELSEVCAHCRQKEAIEPPLIHERLRWAQTALSEINGVSDEQRNALTKRLAGIKRHYHLT